jgi:hypothetical protein
MDKAGSSTCEYALGYTNAEHERLIRRNFIVLGCLINDVLDFGGHFLSLGRDSFFKRGGFSTATRFCNNDRNADVALTHTLRGVPINKLTGCESYPLSSSPL